MKTTSLPRAIVLLIAACILSGGPKAQSQSLKFRIPIVISDSGKLVRSGRLLFGLHPDATTCIDASPLTGFTDHWSESDSSIVREQEGPPPPPGFEVGFSYPTAICATSPYREDIHQYVGSTQIDTFRFKVQLDDTQGDDIHSVKFYWPSVLSAYADSVILIRSVGSVRFRVDMALQDSFILSNYSLSTFGKFLTNTFIILKNPKTPPLPPTITTTGPLDNATNVSLTPTFSWDPVSQAASYHLRLGKDTLLGGVASIVADTMLPGAATSLNRSTPLVANTDYYWSIVVANPYGVSYPQSPPLHFTTALTGAVDQSRDGVPAKFALAQNYPNPFNPATQIKYQLARRAHVQLKVFDSLGREIRTLVDEVEDAGYWSVVFDASNLPSGEYTCRLSAGSYVEIKKMLLVK